MCAFFNIFTEGIGINIDIYDNLQNVLIFKQQYIEVIKNESGIYYSGYTKITLLGENKNVIGIAIFQVD